MQICIHRGSKQIGGSCVEVRSCGKRLLLDLGLPLDAKENSSEYLPEVTGLDGSDADLLGILVSHPHLDHFGLLAHISPEIPVGMGSAARRILAAAAPFLKGNWPEPARGWDYQSGVEFDIGPFRITPFLVDHSAYDSYALLIESDGKRILYSGDFRSHGRKAALIERLTFHPPENIDAMLLEGSSLGRLAHDQRFPTETEVETKLAEAFTAAKGLALVHTSVQNIDRIVTIFRAAKQTGRKLIIDLYAALILEATGNKNIPQSFWGDVALFVPHFQRIQIKKNAWFDQLKRHSANRIFPEHLQKIFRKSVLLFRPLYQSDLQRANCLDKAVYIYSQWEGYWEQGSYDGVKAWLGQHHIAKQSIHTSGHADPQDLQKLVKAIKPRKVVPIHSFNPEIYPELFPDVEAHNDGQWWEI